MRNRSPHRTCYSRRLHVLLLGLVLCPVFCLTCTAQSRSELEKQKAAAQKDIADTESLLKETQKKQQVSIQTVNLLNAKINKRNELLTTIRKSIRSVNEELAETEQQIRFTERNIAALKEKYAQLVRQAYRNRGQYTPVLWVFAAKDINEAALRMKYFQEIADYRKKQVATITAEQNRLTVSRATLQAQRDEKVALLGEEQHETEKLQAEKQQQSAVTKQLKTKESQLKKELEQKRAAAQKLDRTIQELIAAEAAKKKAAEQKGKETEQIADLKLSSSFKENKGKLPWPCSQGVITGKFGNYAHPVYPSITLQNSGIDITVPAQSGVRTVFEGKVLYVALIPGSNMAVVVQHGDYISLYQNLVDVPVKAGDQVRTGQTVGSVYTVPGEGTATMHFEIWEGVQKLNPALWIASK